MGNKRVFYACQGLALDGEPLRGVQNVSVRTENNNHVVDEWGTHKIYNHYVDTPRSTISLSRIMTFGGHPVATGSITGSGMLLRPIMAESFVCILFQTRLRPGYTQVQKLKIMFFLKMLV